MESGGGGERADQARPTEMGGEATDGRAGAGSGVAEVDGGGGGGSEGGARLLPDGAFGHRSVELRLVHHGELLL